MGMARNRSRRTPPVRDRLGIGEATSITCPTCRKRLVLAWPSDGGYIPSGVDFIPADGVQHEKAMSGPVLNIAHEDWHSFTCPRCKGVEQVREAKMRALAEAHPGGSVSITAPVEIEGPLWQRARVTPSR